MVVMMMMMMMMTTPKTVMMIRLFRTKVAMIFVRYHFLPPLVINHLETDKFMFDDYHLLGDDAVWLLCFFTQIFSDIFSATLFK
jgi:hypothetical protein